MLTITFLGCLAVVLLVAVISYFAKPQYNKHSVDGKGVYPHNAMLPGVTGDSGGACVADGGSAGCS